MISNKSAGSKQDVAFGDEWHFWLTLHNRAQIEHNKQYPYILESKYDAPAQYPDYDDEDYEEDEAKSPPDRKGS